MKEKKALFYSHGGSANHGCEAIVRGSIKILNSFEGFKLASKEPKEDCTYELNKVLEVVAARDNIKKNRLSYFIYLIRMKIFKLDSIYYKELYKNITKKSADCTLAFSIGGDNYCYKGFSDELKVLNNKFKSKGLKTVLWGCSIEPGILSNEIIEDLSVYSLIVARESITFNALLKAGLRNVKMYPDPAFQLKRIDLQLPVGFLEGNTIGINVSPLIIKSEINNGITLRNYTNLINYIINNTAMQVALIPHVVWNHNDDRKPLNELFNYFAHTKRVLQIGDFNAMQLKGFIARCRFFIAARTHASIAAYSEKVPTLVVGYSVKAIGIAKDIFGTHQGYVLPVQSLEKENDLTKAFQILQKNEAHIIKHYASMMDAYKAKSLEAGKEITL